MHRVHVALDVYTQNNKTKRIIGIIGNDMRIIMGKFFGKCWKESNNNWYSFEHNY